MARAKLDLRRFQQELATRLASKTAAQVESSRLGLACAGGQWLIRLADAGEVTAVPAVADVPLTKPWFRGLANIRGNLFSVIDLAAYQGGEPTPVTPDARLLLVAERYNMAAALLVNRMLGLRNLQQFEAAPTTGERAWERARFKDKDG